ncbi:MAG: hypothetical protein GX608_13675 [Lentisphaerae bacterium]|nr:hypothetical protein [Lentisphaerota bacterium]
MKAGEILIGWSSKDASSPRPVNLPGQFHMRISKGILDPITVNALVIGDGSDTAIFVSVDTCIILAPLLEKARAKISAASPEIPVKKMLLNSTHIHSGPGYWGGNKALADSSVMTDEEYGELLTDRIAEAVCEAHASRASGGFSYGYGYACVAHSRRSVYFDDLSKRPGNTSNSTHGLSGHAAMYGETNDEMFSHYEAGADHFINIFFTFDKNDKLTGALINIPCPSQCSENIYMQSADYWHNIREAIRAKFGNIFILGQCGSAGDLSPHIQHYKKAQERRQFLKYGKRNDYQEELTRRDIAEQAFNAFSEVYEWARKDIIRKAAVKHAVKTVNLSRRLISDAEYEDCKAGLAALEKTPVKTDGTREEQITANSYRASGIGRYKGILKRYAEQKTVPTHPMELHVVAIGDVAFTASHFELYMDYMHRIQARSPFTQTFVAQLTNGSVGYLATERGEWGRGYSASMFCNIVSHKGGQELVEETVKTLKELRV